MPLTRRGLLALVALGPALAPGRALAALHMPLKEPPPRVRPLGVWALSVRKIEVVQDGSGPVDVTVPLQFRPAIGVATPIERWWRKSRLLPIPVTSQTLTPPWVSGIWVDVPITITVPVGTKKGGYRISCDMSDPDTHRRSLFTFLLQVIDQPRA